MRARREKFAMIILACCVLHNILLKKNPRYVAESSSDSEETNNSAFYRNTWHEMAQSNSRDRYEDGKHVRQTFNNYFCNEESVP